MATKQKVVHHWQLEVFQLARQLSQRFFRASKSFPLEERYSLTDQGRRASRAVSAIIAEAWRRRKYEAAFVNKLNEAEGEAAETQVWVMHAVDCEYLTESEGRELHRPATASLASSSTWATGLSRGCCARPQRRQNDAH